MEHMCVGLGHQKGTGMPNVTQHPRGKTIFSAGFTLIEMLVAMTLMALLMALAMPSMTEWVRNSKVRAVSDALQNGLRMAQAEALRRSRQTVFSLTNASAPQAGVAATANGSNWSINALPSMSAGESGVFVQSGVLADVGAGVQITGPASICFNSIGRLVANNGAVLTGITGGATCATTSEPTYDITVSGSDRPMRVLVALGGQVRMCDPAKTLSASNPDGCPLAPTPP